MSIIFAMLTSITTLIFLDAADKVRAALALGSRSRPARGLRRGGVAGGDGGLGRPTCILRDEAGGAAAAEIVGKLGETAAEDDEGASEGGRGEEEPAARRRVSGRGGERARLHAE
ncbi:hypothetical protein Syun_015378 [Stephania yunnanensis]|uniref:Uncharacterized protein n=1 Tax=Stephania yunnanensis TaxID=152371 RepID=A0AAP0JL27_9MAGN